MPLVVWFASLPEALGSDAGLGSLAEAVRARARTHTHTRVPHRRTRSPLTVLPDSPAVCPGCNWKPRSPTHKTFTPRTAASRARGGGGVPPGRAPAALSGE